MMKKKLAILLLTLLSAVLFVCGCNLTPIEAPTFTGTYENITAFVTDEITVPDVEYTEGATLTVTVNAPTGSVVEVVDGKFVLTEEGVYVITYSISIANLSEEMQIKVTATKNTQKPTLILNGSNVESVLLGEEVTIASATAEDAIGGALNVDIAIKDANGDPVAIAEGKFTASVLGDYTVTYSAEDKYGNKQEIVNVINCYKLPDPVAPVPEGVANSFETEEESYIEALNNETAAYTVVRNSTDDNVNGVRSGAYSLKLSAAAGGTFNLLSEVINGSKDLSEIANISLYAYNPLESNLGFSIYKVILKNGTSVTPNLYKVIPAGEWLEYSVNLMDCGLTAEDLKNVYAIQLWSATGLSEVYIDDISYDLRSDYPTIGEVEASLIAKLNVEMQIAVPTVNEGAEISYKLTDANGNEIPVENGKWIPSVAGVYTITYTATKCEHVATATTTVTVADKPVITLNGENVTVATVGDEITVATASAKDFFNEDLTVVITVTDANAQEVVLTDGKFTANVIGEYTVKYSVEDAHGNANEIQNVIECKPEPVSKGEVPAGVVNSFETEEECRIAENTANSGGYTLTHNSTNDNADGVRSGAYSLKVENSGSKNFNLVAETILGTKDLSEVGKISFWIYNPLETSQGMSIYGIVFTDGSSVKTEVYKSIPAKSWLEFSYNYTTNEAITEEKLESVFSIQFWGIKEVYIDDISVVYRKDIKPAEPANTAISFEGFGAAFTATNIAMNTDPQYVIDGSLSLQMTLVNSGEWSVAKYSRWGKGIRFTEDYNAITMQVYASKAVRVTFLVGTGGNSGGATYLGYSNTKAYALEEGWNEVTINFDTDITEKTAPIKEGIVYFGAQAVIDSYEGPGSLTNMIVNNSGAVLYVDAVLAVNVETPDLTPPSKGEVPEGVVNSFETEEECRISENTANSGGYTLTHNSTNDNADGVRSGAYSLHVVNSGSKNFNLVAETILGSQDLSEVAKISFWIYNPLETAQGMSIYRTVLKNGTALKTEVYKSIPAKSWWEFVYDYSTNSEITREQLTSVFSIQFWGIKEVYIDDISVVYREKVVVDFESFTEIANGAASSASGGAGISLNTDAAKAKSGNNSIKIVANQSCQVHVKPAGIFGFQDLSAYSAVELYVYCDTAKAFNLMAFLPGSGGSIDHAINTTLKAGEWNKITIDLTNEVFTTYNIWSFKFWMSGGEGIVFYVDDITLIPA